SAAGEGFCKARMRPIDLYGRLVGRQAVTKTPVDRCLGGIQSRQRLTPLVHVIELAPHHRRQQSPPAMRAQHAHPGDPAARQPASRHGHLVGEDARCGDDLRAIEKRQRAVELGDLPGDRQLLVGRERRAKGSTHQRRVGALLFRSDRPELKLRRRAYRWTSARARQGLPDPLTSFSGATSRTAPVGGSFARLASWVRPYLLAPSRNRWQGKGGLNECAAPASVPTVSTPTPLKGLSLASHWASSMSMPGVCGPVSFAFRKAFWSLARASQPVR